MKALLIALFVTAVVAASLDNAHLHFHINRTDPRMNGFVNRFVDSIINKDQKNVEFHLHLDDLSDFSEDELEDFGFDFPDIGGIVDKVKDGVNTAIDGIKKGFDITNQGIDVAIRQTGNAFGRVRDQIQSISLPLINVPEAIRPMIDIARIVSNLVPCALTIQKILPTMYRFVKAASSNNAVECVRQLLYILPNLPDITQKCLNKPFNIPPNVMSKIQCSADIVALAAIVIQLLVFPENVIGNISGLTSMIDLIPLTISDCTGAFN